VLFSGVIALECEEFNCSIEECLGNNLEECAAMLRNLRNLKGSSVVGTTKKCHDENWNVRILLIVVFDKQAITGNYLEFIKKLYFLIAR
jgi:hypothetical protein